MKKSFFPVLIAAVALLFSSCIKNVESEGVKAVRVGQGALLTAQAAAETTRATSQAALDNANAALLTAQASVQTAMAAQTTANIAVTAEQTRHDAAVNKIKEEIAAAASTVRKAELVNALAVENAESANTLVQLAQAKATLEFNLANSAIVNAKTLADAQLIFDKAKLTNAQNLAKAQLENDVFVANLKAIKLDSLAYMYNAAFTKYTDTQLKINKANNALITLQDALVKEVTGIVDTTDVKAQRTILATKKASLVAANEAVVTATTADEAALGLIVATKAAKSGTELGVLLTANESKIAAEKIVKAGLISNYYVALAIAEDADKKSTRVAAIAKTAADLDAIDVATKAILNTTVTPNTGAAKDSIDAKAVVESAKSALVTAKADSALAYADYQVELTWTVKFNTVAQSPMVTAKNAPAAEKTTGQYNPNTGFWASDNDFDQYQAAVIFAQGKLDAYNAKLTALATAYTALATANTKYATANTKVTAARAKLATAKTTYTASKAISDDLKAKYDALVAAADAINAKVSASSTKIADWEAFSVQLKAWIVQDPSTAALDLAIAKAIYAQDSTKPIPAGVDPADGTKQLLAMAKQDAKNATDAVKEQEDYLASVISAYTAGLPLSLNLAQNHIAYVNAQIADKTAEIANLTSILAQQKGVVDMWLEKIRLALA